MGQPSSAAARSGIGVVDKSVAILAAVADAPRSLADLVDATDAAPRDGPSPRRGAGGAPTARPRCRWSLRPRTARRRTGGRRCPTRSSRPPAPVLAWVRDECGESAQLYRRDGAERVCVAAAERAHGLRTTVPVGSRLPLTGRLRRAGAVRLVGPVVTRPTSSPTPSSPIATARRGAPTRVGAVGRHSARPASPRCRRRS